MPSVTVVVSSDTDIYISPGLYGDCLPTDSTDGAADSFRAGPSLCPRCLPCSHTPPPAVRGCGRRLWTAGPGRSAPGRGRTVRATGIHVTRTLWPSSK
ncbi:hypothetical protein GEV49_28310 [Streptomyces sp. SYP-A7193]|nr:hypothetical protein GEV49_28310 [Streptomyces sp. SYP-A7193]